MSIAPPPPPPGLARRTAVVAGVVLGFVVAGLVAWQAVHALILIAAAALVALLLSGLARLVAGHTPLGYSVSLWTSVVVLVAVLGALGWFVGDGVAEQVAGVSEAVPVSLGQVEENVRGWMTGLGINMSGVPAATDMLPSPGEMASRAFGVLGTALGVLGSVLAIVVLGLFLAASPATYRTGVLHLVPHRHRARAGEVFSATVRALRRWLAARFIAMVLTGLISWGGLTLLGVPFAGGLAVLSGLVVFIPYIGSYLSGSVAVLVALLDSPQTALYTAVFYVVMENVLGQIVEPLVEARLTSAPPALLISAQLVFGLVLGVWGILLASPLVVAIAVVVQMLYVNDALGDDVQVLGETE